MIGKNFDEPYALLETMVSNHYQWPMTRMNQPKVVGIYELDVVTALAAQVETLTKKIDALVCEICAGNHPSGQCAISAESVHYIDCNNRQQGMNSNSYNLGWRNHLNFS